MGREERLEKRGTCLLSRVGSAFSNPARVSSPPGCCRHSLHINPEKHKLNRDFRHTHTKGRPDCTHTLRLPYKSFCSVQLYGPETKLQKLGYIFYFIAKYKSVLLCLFHEFGSLSGQGVPEPGRLHLTPGFPPSHPVKYFWLTS